MPKQITIQVTPELYLEIKEKLLKGDELGVERKLRGLCDTEVEEILTKAKNEIMNSPEGKEIAKRLANKYGYEKLRRKWITITTAWGKRIKIKSWYGLLKGKKIGRPKSGPNGRGQHLLLRYWGYINKHSLSYLFDIALSGVIAQSYDLAAEELKERGYNLTSNVVDRTVQKVGVLAQRYGHSSYLIDADDFTGKRVMLLVDGGRSRTRALKTGRHKKGQKQTGFKTPWREPKLLVISEIDEQGKKPRGSKPIYRGTVGNADELFTIMDELVEKCTIDKAREIVFLADGADWIWERFKKVRKDYRVSYKTTEILDWYHAREHISKLGEAIPYLNGRERKGWCKRLQGLLKVGNYRRFKAEVFAHVRKIEQLKNRHVQTNRKQPEAKKCQLRRLFNYFEKHKHRMKYHAYRTNKQPIGSGMIESAIRRVINLRLKGSSSFWKLDRLENILYLRCIVMSGRWTIFKQNIRYLYSFNLDVN
jgi:hypothetical protein